MCFLVTVSELTLLGITAPFWGIVFGCLVAWLLDPKPQKAAPVTEEKDKGTVADSAERAANTEATSTKAPEASTSSPAASVPCEHDVRSGARR